MASTATQPKAFLVSPTIDLMAVGGLSLICFALLILSAPFSTAIVPGIAASLWILSMLVNYPHFIVSYQLLYRDQFHYLTSDFRYLLASFIVPAILLAYVLATIALESKAMLVWFVQFYLFIVGWHYIKQTFGTLMVFGGRAQIRFSSPERILLLVHLYTVWAAAYVALQTGVIERYFVGISALTFSIPVMWLQISYTLFALTTVAVVLMLIQKVRREQLTLPLPIVASLTAIYVWMVPAYHEPAFILLVPFFHSLQYLLFVYTLKRNEFRSESSNTKSPGRRLLQLYGLLILGGVTVFVSLPMFIAQFSTSWTPFATAVNLVILIAVFINIHHYFIDHAIWRSKNPQVRAHLFGRT